MIDVQHLHRMDEKRLLEWFAQFEFDVFERHSKAAYQHLATVFNEIDSRYAVDMEHPSAASHMPDFTVIEDLEKRLKFAEAALDTH